MLIHKKKPIFLNQRINLQLTVFKNNISYTFMQKIQGFSSYMSASYGVLRQIYSNEDLLETLT